MKENKKDDTTTTWTEYYNSILIIAKALNVPPIQLFGDEESMLLFRKAALEEQLKAVNYYLRKEQNEQTPPANIGEH